MTCACKDRLLEQHSRCKELQSCDRS